MSNGGWAGNDLVARRIRVAEQVDERIRKILL